MREQLCVCIACLFKWPAYIMELARHIMVSFVIELFGILKRREKQKKENEKTEDLLI